MSGKKAAIVPGAWGGINLRPIHNWDYGQTRKLYCKLPAQPAS